jgi:hypothetical protein
MEIQGHEITIAKANTKKAKVETAFVAPTASGKVVAANILEAHLSLLIVKVYENGVIETKVFPKSKAMTSEWTALH